MTQECFDIYKTYFACKITDLADKYVNQRKFGLTKASCTYDELFKVIFMFESIRCFCFYTEAEQEADDALTTGDKSEFISHDDIMLIITGIKRIVEKCGC